MSFLNNKQFHYLCAANFKLPETGESFDEVRYIELNEEESRPLVEQYNKEGKAAGFGQQAPFSGQGKKFKNDRPSFRGGGGGERGFRGGRGSGKIIHMLASVVF